MNIPVTWSDGESIRLPVLWLRDNCNCTECRLEQTGEKKFHLGTVPLDLEPAEYRVEADVLHIRWQDNHATQYTREDISCVVATAETGINKNWQAWDKDFKPARVDYQDFLDSDQVAIVAIEAFLQSGVIILEQAPTEPDRMEALRPRLGPIREVLFARIHNVEVDPAGYNVAHTALPLLPHNDFASYSWPPSVQALHMLCNETSGGDSIVVDGWGILGRFRIEDPEKFEVLKSVEVPFREFDDNNETFTIAPIIQCAANGDIQVFRYSNQLMQPMDPTRPEIEDFYRAYHSLSQRIVGLEHRINFRLEAGQILLVASHRVLHGREAFEPRGRRHLQDAYFEHDNIRNHLVVLNRRAIL